MRVAEGCSLPPEMADDAWAWPACIHCGFMYTKNDGGICGWCRRVEGPAIPPAFYSTLMTQPDYNRHGQHK